MKHILTFRSTALMMILAPLLVLSGCITDSDNGNGTVPFTGNAIIIPGINPAFDSITEVAASAAPGGPYADVLVADTDYTYNPLTESIALTGSVATAGGYVRITGLATLTGTQSSYTVYTYVANLAEVAANELTSQAVALVAAGDAANFDAALALVEMAYGLEAGSVTSAVLASDRPAALTGVLATLAPGFVGGAFDVNGFDAADLASGPADYQACIALGGLAWDSWHKTGAGGSGLPTAEPDNDYTRCKACHGWDQQGTDGGYVRRSRNAGRANAGNQDPNNCDLPGAVLATCTKSRNISSDTTFGRGTAIEIAAGGRIWAEGSKVFDSLWGAGAIRGNRHPNLGAPEGPTAAQLGCLTAFLNAPEARADRVFAAMDILENPVLYTPVATANATAGASFYAANCMGCHGDPSADSGPPDLPNAPPLTGGLIAYLNQDGKFSEFMHKMHWGIPNTIMNRSVMGDPTAADVANVVAYMQAVPFMELSAAQVVPPVAGIMARGSGTFTLTDVGLEYVITIDPLLSSDITSVQLHAGRVGVNGDAVHTLDPPLSGTWTGLSPAQRAALLDGDYYVLVHTSGNPAGEIRGQVKAMDDTDNQSPTACFAVSPSLTVDPDTLVMLDASCSSDLDGPEPLTYAWLLAKPSGSGALLSSTDALMSSFTPDVQGNYTVTLTVNDSLAEDAAMQTVTAGTALPDPTASELAGRDLYDAECAGCHGASEWDNSAGEANLTAADARPVIANLSSYGGGMRNLSTQEVTDLSNFLDGICVQVPSQCMP